MKLLVIRHGEPDYEHDCLTAHGREQAALLGKRLADMEIDGAFTSPMGRARETAGIALEGRGMDIRVLGWLHEFDVKVRDRDLGEGQMVWDICPKNWTGEELLYHRRDFALHPDMTGTGIGERYEAVCRGVDELLAGYGLVRENGYYRKDRDCGETLALFCHFGATCVVIARLLGISPVLALQSFSAEPTAIATLCTDDRFGERVNFRLHGYGDIAHLGETGPGQINYK